MSRKQSWQLALSMVLCGASSAWAQTNPSATSPTSAPTTQPATLPVVDSALRPITRGISVSINGSGAAEARQGWPLIISAGNPATQPAPLQPRIEIQGSDGKPVAWTLKPVPATGNRFVWVVAPGQTQSAPAGSYKIAITLEEGTTAKAASATLTLVAAADAPTPLQLEQAPFVLAAYQMRIGDTAAAAKVVDDALKLDPEHVGLLMLRGDVLMSSGDYSAAVSSYSQAIEARAKLVTDDDNDPPVLLMAKLRHALNKANEGKELLNDKPK